MTVEQDSTSTTENNGPEGAAGAEPDNRKQASAPWQIAVRSRLGQLELTQRLLGNVTPDSGPTRPPPDGPGADDQPSRATRATMLAAQATERIAAAKAAANLRRTFRSSGRPTRAWWRGSDIEKAWTETHAAEALIIASAPIGCERSVPVILDAVAIAGERLKPTDHRLVELQKATKDLPGEPETITETVIGLAATTVSAAYEAADLEQRQVRDFRNVLIMMTLVLTVFAGTLALLPQFWPNLFSMCWDSPSGAQVCPVSGFGASRGDVATIELMGLIGAMLTGALAVRRIRGTATPYAVPMLSLIVKLPIGALTAFGSLLLLHLLSAFSVHSSVEIAAYAIIFGASQQAFTRLIDKQAQNVLDSVPTAGKDGAKEDDP